MEAIHGLPAGQLEEWERKARLISAAGEPPHFAPDANMLAIQHGNVAAHIARNGREGTALVLGATPELADLAVREGLRVISVDCNARMFEAAAKRRRTQDPGMEATLVANWLDMRMIRNGQIDIVLGDASLNNVPHEQMSAVIAEIARITHPGSMVSLRQIVMPDGRVPEYEFPNAVAALRAGRISKHDFDRVLRYYSFNSRVLEPARSQLDARRVFDIIREKRAAAELTADEYDFLMGRYSEVTHTVYRLSEQVGLLRQLGTCEVEMLPETCFFRSLMAIFLVRVQ